MTILYKKMSYLKVVLGCTKSYKNLLVDVFSLGKFIIVDVYKITLSAPKILNIAFCAKTNCFSKYIYNYNHS